MKSYKISQVVSLVLLVIILAIIFWWSKDWLLSNPQDFVLVVKSYGPIAPLVMILILIVEVVIAPFPGGWVPLVSGYIFGAFWGGLYAWLGNVLGATISFSLAYYLGQPIVERFVNPKKIKYFQDWLARKPGLILFVYLLPILPIDLITVALGLTGLKFKRFIPIMMVGLLPHMFFLSFFGERMKESQFHTVRPLLSPLLILLVCLVIYWQVRRRQKLKSNT